MLDIALGGSGLHLSETYGGIGVYKKPQNRANNNRKPHNRNKFRSKLKTASKTREDVHAVEVIEAQIFRRETRKTPNRVQ